MGKIICIKPRSHSDFELYLIGEKYQISYNFLIEYKKDSSIYKFWTEVGSGKVMAIEERPSEKKKKFIPIILDADENELKSIKPIISGHVLSKYKGDIEKKEEEFKKMIADFEKKKKEMLSRKYDPSNIICINTNYTNEQLFSVCIKSKLDFIEVVGFIENNSHLSITKVWYEKETSELVAYEYVDNSNEYFEINESCLIPRDAIHKMSRKSINTPRLKVTEDVIFEYKRIKKNGFDINISKLEKFFLEEESLDITMDLFSIEYLNNLLQVALESEDYESAAEIRDIIKELKNK